MLALLSCPLAATQFGPIAERLQCQRHSRRSHSSCWSLCSLPQEAQDIFGDVSSLMDMYNSRRRPSAGAGDQGDEQDLDEEDFGDDEEAAEQYRLEREERDMARADARARAQVLLFRV